MMDRVIVVTGVGCLPAMNGRPGLEELPQPAASKEGTRFRPFPPFALADEVPSRADQRAMSRSMHAAAWTAGKALGMAALKGNQPLLEETEIMTAGRCVERDEDLDDVLIDAMSTSEDLSLFNKILRENTRPSLFLTQLPNLISANISIIHGVKGRSQTLFGEGLGGVEAIGITVDRLLAGEAVRSLVGGVSSGEARISHEMAMLAPAGARVAMLGSMAAYCVLEAAVAAEARGQPAIAKVVRHQRLAIGKDPARAAHLILEAVGPLDGTEMVAIASVGDAAARTLEDAICATLDTRTDDNPVYRLTERLGAVFEATAPALLAFGASEVSSPNPERASRAILVNLAGHGWATISELESVDA